MMDKQHEAGGVAADSISTVEVNVKDYPPSEVYSSEPPPAYVRPRTSAVQIARIAAVTLVAVSVILGFFMLGSAYITATYSCSYVPQDYPTGQEPEDRPSYQHLVDPLDSEESRHLRQAHNHILLEEQPPQPTTPPQQPKSKKEDEVVQEVDNDPEEDSVPLSQSSSESQEKPIQIRLPLQLDFDELANSLMEKNQKSRMNCVVEKKRAEEIMDHMPKMVRLPFGINVTTDPAYERITGERMAIYCESGNEQRHVPMEQQITPVMVPVHVHHAVPVPVPVPHLMAQQQMMSQMPPHMQSQQQMMPQMPQQMPPHMQSQQRMMPPRPFNIHQLHQLQQQQRQMHQMHMHQLQMQQMQPPQMRPQMIGPPPQMQPPHMRPQMMGPPPPPAVLQQLEQLQRMQRMQPPQPQVVFTPHQVEVQPVQVIREEEHVIPIIQIEREEESEESAPQERPVVPADTVRPPPPPQHHFQRVPPPQVQIPIGQIQQLQQLQQQEQMESTRPHYVQPRSVRSVDSVLHRREKRVRRCACDCSC